MAILATTLGQGGASSEERTGNTPLVASLRAERCQTFFYALMFTCLQKKVWGPKCGLERSDKRTMPKETFFINSCFLKHFYIYKTFLFLGHIGNDPLGMSEGIGRAYNGRFIPATHKPALTWILLYVTILWRGISESDNKRRQISLIYRCLYRL